MIALALQKDNYVYVYDENNFQLYYQLGELVGFTATTVSIKRDNCIFVVDDKGASLYYRNI